ncbi:MAG: DUF192 domain-containing protein [Thermodesulfobacteriota bacterium]
MRQRRIGSPLAAALLLAGVLLMTGARAASAQGALPAFPRAEVEVRAAGGNYRFAVEVAATPLHRERGFMFRTELAPDAGMLFVHEAEREVAMWMKNTLIPLDMLFLAADGTIVRIEESTEPLSLRTISSGAPVKGVLELPGGTSRRLGIVPGDRVVHSAFAAGG